MATFLLASARCGAAEDATAPATIDPVWRDVSAGGEATRNSWSVYSAMTFSPFGGLDEDGFRLRTVSGYGRYRYQGARIVGGTSRETEFRGISSFTDLMAGYQHQIGPTTFKGFAGASLISHGITPIDRGNEVSGLAYGFKAAVELWSEISAKAWTSTDLSYTVAHETYAARVRGGWRMVPELSAGIEAGLHGNATFDGARGGLFLRYAPDWGEISLSGGVTGDIDKPTTPYAGVNWLMHY